MIFKRTKTVEVGFPPPEQNEEDYTPAHTLIFNRPTAGVQSGWHNRTAGKSATELFGDAELVSECADDIATFLLEEDGERVGYSGADLESALAPAEIVGLWFSFWGACSVGEQEKKVSPTVSISPTSKIPATTIASDVETVSSLRAGAENHSKSLDPITQETKKCDVHDTPSTPPL